MFPPPNAFFADKNAAQPLIFFRALLWKPAGFPASRAKKSKHLCGVFVMQNLLLEVERIELSSSASCLGLTTCLLPYKFKNLPLCKAPHVEQALSHICLEKMPYGIQAPLIPRKITILHEPLVQFCADRA